MLHVDKRTMGRDAQLNWVVLPVLYSYVLHYNLDLWVKWCTMTLTSGWSVASLWDHSYSRLSHYGGEYHCTNLNYKLLSVSGYYINNNPITLWQVSLRSHNTASSAQYGTRALRYTYSPNQHYTTAELCKRILAYTHRLRCGWECQVEELGKGSALAADSFCLQVAQVF